MERDDDLQLWAGSGEDDSFIRLFNQIRMSKNVDKSDLCRGICGGGLLTRFEQEDRPLKIMLRDRFLSRLGVYGNRYEKILNGDEYLEWKQRMDIVTAVAKTQPDRAQELLEKYYQDYPAKCKGSKYMGCSSIETQFYYAMAALVQMQRGCSNEEIYESIDRAVRVTVPKVDIIPLKSLLLCPQEINLILERIRYREGEKLAGYQEIIDYIEDSLYDDWCKVQVYPKAVFYYVMELIEGDYLSEIKDVIKVLSRYSELLVLCEGAVELIRDTGLAYYLYELLEAREIIYLRILGMLSDKVKDEYHRLYAENRWWKESLKSVYDQAGVACCMGGYAYLYVENDVYYLGDVVSSRRELYGLSRKEAALNICSVNTLMRVEREEINVQRVIREELFERLKLPKENFHGDIITEDYRAILLARKVQEHGNLLQLEEMQEALGQLECLLDQESNINRQFLERNRLNLLWARREITREEYLASMQEVLEYTVPFEEIFDKGGCYLTNEELLCLYNMCIRSTDQERERYIKCLQEVCRWYEKQEEQGAVVQIKKYSTLVRHIASSLGNVGRYEESDEMSRGLLKLCMENRRLWNTDAAIYCLLWNELQRHYAQGGEELPPALSEKRKTYLSNCLAISEICKEKSLFDFYKGKLQD